MNKRFKRLLSLLCVLIITLSGCSNDSNYSIIYENDKTNISYAWWGSDDRNEYTMNGINIFRERYPNINVELRFGTWGSYKKRQNIYMRSHDQPDVMLINYDWVEKYSPDGKGFYDLYKLSEQIDLSNFSKEDLSYGEVNGKLNALPIALNSQILYYNKGILDRYGLEIPKTWDDLFDAAKVLSKDNIYVLAPNNKSVFFILIAYFEQTTGKSVCDKDGNIILTKDDIKIMLNFYKRLIKEKVVMPINNSTANSFFVQDVVGVVRWASGAGSYFHNAITDRNIEVVVGDFIVEKDAKLFGWYIKPSTMYAISDETANPKEAAQLLNFLINDPEMAQLQGTEKGIPLSKSAIKGLDKKDVADVETQAYNKMLEFQNELRITPPILEVDALYGGFVSEADYYAFEKQGIDEVTERIYYILQNIQIDSE